MIKAHPGRPTFCPRVAARGSEALLGWRGPTRRRPGSLVLASYRFGDEIRGTHCSSFSAVVKSARLVIAPLRRGAVSFFPRWSLHVVARRQVQNENRCVCIVGALDFTAGVCAGGEGLAGNRFLDLLIGLVALISTLALAGAIYSIYFHQSKRAKISAAVQINRWATGPSWSSSQLPIMSFSRSPGNSMRI